MSEYNPWTSGIRSNRSTNWATTTAPSLNSLAELAMEGKKKRCQKSDNNNENDIFYTFLMTF